MAAVDAYLKIEGIDGESTDSKHKGEIELVSFQIGAKQEGVAGTSGSGGGGAGKVAFQDMACTANVSKASPALMLACASGEHFKTATLAARKAGKDQQEYMKITLTEVVISSYQHGVHTAANILPVDQFSLSFSKIEYEYKEQKADGTLGGSVKKGWDLSTNKKV
jgi:type VI secretion system secreted protein Hcp